MSKKVYLRIFKPWLFLPLILGILTPLVPLSSAGAQQAFKTQRALIYCDRPADLQEMDRRLHFIPEESFVRSYFYTPTPVQAAVSPGLAAKIDGLLAQVCLILNMGPQRPERVRIFVVKDGEQVRQRLLALNPCFPGPSVFGLLGFRNLKAFYESRTRSIILSLADVNEGILAHEMAHFVLCTSRPGAPSEEVQERWCQYVETSVGWRPQQASILHYYAAR